MNCGFHDIEKYIELLKKKGMYVESHIPFQYRDINVNYISYDSNDIIHNTLFICKGMSFKEEYLMEAVDKGAFVYVCDEELNEKIEVADSVGKIVVTDIRKAMAWLADYFYNSPWKSLTTVGITGTKGKSSTAYFMKYIFDDYMEEYGGEESGVISGIDNYDGVVKEESHLTTPEAVIMERHFRNAVDKGIKFFSMEVSSQALKYNRTLGIIFDVGCFLNLGIDHISDLEHSDFEDYAAAKMKLFSQCKTAVVNMDSEYGERAVKVAKESALKPRIVTFSVEEEFEYGSANRGNASGVDVKAYHAVAGTNGIKFRVKSDSFDEEFELGMTGFFNVSNATAAIAMAYSLNIPLKNIRRGLKRARVSGRMEIFQNEEKNVTILVDYAHNEMSFTSLFKSVKKEHPEKKVIIVFGCPGKKALGRRKELGTLAGIYADLSIITEEDAGEESLESISREIAEHISTIGGDLEIILDREAAIKRALELAEKGDTIVLITGKGRETRQKRGKKYVNTPSDVDYVREYMGCN